MTASSAGDALLAPGARLFDGGRPWAAHEAWERIWLAQPHGPRRDYLQGLIQLAAVCHHLQRGARSPARRVLDTARARLRLGAAAAHPWSAARLLAACDHLAAVLDAGGLPPAPSLHLAHAFSG